MTFWRFVWDTSEFTEIPIGRHAPWVLGKALGMENKRLKTKGDE